MLDFVKRAFRSGIEIILWINVILSTIAGGIIGNSLGNLISYRNAGGYAFFGMLVGVICGLFVNIIVGGFISTILSIDENLEQLRFHITGIPKKDVTPGYHSTNMEIHEWEQYKVITNTAIRSGPQHDSIEKMALNIGDTVCFKNFLQDDPTWCYVKTEDSKTEGWCFYKHLEKC